MEVLSKPGLTTDSSDVPDRGRLAGLAAKLRWLQKGGGTVHIEDQEELLLITLGSIELAALAASKGNFRL